MSATHGRNAIQHQTLHVEGMHCASCVSRIESALRSALPALDDVRVNFADGRVVLEGPVDAREACAIIERLGYHASPELREAVRPRGAEDPRWRIALLLTMPLVAIHMGGWRFPGSEAVQFILATVVLFGCGQEIFRNAWLGVRQGSPGMDTLIALGSGAAWFYSALHPFLPPASSHEVPDLSGHLYYETAAMTVSLVLLGRHLEMRARRRAGDAVEALVKLRPETLLLKRNGNFETVPIEAACVDEIALVRPGAAIPLDGVVLEGESAVYESMMTGESRPVPKKPGDPLIGGTLNGSGGLVFRITRVGEETMLSQIIDLVTRAISGKPPIQRLADRVAGIFTPIVLLISVVTLSVWLLTGHPSGQGLSAAIATLVVACPCALGLATPVAIQVGLGRLAQAGVLIRDVDGLELMQRLNILAMDKTGTLTQGRPEVLAFEALPTVSPTDCVRWAAALETRSEHPLADAIVRYATSQSQDEPLPDIQAFFSETGEGVGGCVAQRSLLLGSLAFLMRHGVNIPPALQNRADQAAMEAQSAVFLAVDGHPAGLFLIADPIRPEAAEAIGRLRRMGIRPIMLSGDRPEVAMAVGRALGLAPDEIKGGVSPGEKQAFIRMLQQAPPGEHRPVVGMAGDGINDAPALAQADIGIAMGDGTDIAMQNAHMTLLHGNIAKIATAVETSRAIVRIIRQNLFWAFFYNLLALPLAAMGLLNPMLAAAAMALSSLSVVLNALRLRL